MIRITYADNSVEEYNLSLNEVLRITKYSKIEKQSKDLTLEEISKLKAQVIVIHTAPLKVVDEIPLYGSRVEKAKGKHYDTYKLDWNDHFYDLEDYIDITDLVKDND